MTTHNQHLRLVNLTSHTVAVMPDGETKLFELPPSGTFARIREIREQASDLPIDGGSLPVWHLHYAREIDGLPRQQPGVGYLVSRVTASAVRRPDVYFPLDEVRDTDGRIIGCRVLGQFTPDEPDTGS